MNTAELGARFSRLRGADGIGADCPVVPCPQHVTGTPGPGYTWAMADHLNGIHDWTAEQIEAWFRELETDAA